MATPQSSISILIRHSHRRQCNSTRLVRYFCTESRDDETSKPSPSHIVEVAQKVCNIVRTRPRWEQTMVSEFPGFNFSDPIFIQQFLNLQSNLLLCSRFISWCVSHYGSPPDHGKSELLFDALVEAKACNAAKWLIDLTGFEPGAASFERYARCLWEGGPIEDAMGASSLLKALGACPEIGTWNMAFSRCLKLGRTDLFFVLYKWLDESGMKADQETAEYRIRAFSDDGRASEGYEFLREALKDELVPRNIAFNKLIRGFLKEKDTDRVSDLLHIMIAKNCMPDIYTYQEVINGLCKRRKKHEVLRIFSDLKDRGYFPDRVMYTTMIHGLCKAAMIGEARKLWFEMIHKGMVPNEYTYNAMIQGYLSIGNIDDARKLFLEMSDKGFGESTVIYNNMIVALSSNKRVDEAWQMFQEMPQKGISRDAITYGTMIQGLCRKLKIVESTSLLKEAIEKGFQPLSSSSAALIEKLSRVGRPQEAQKLAEDMESQGLALFPSCYDRIVIGFCKQGFVTEAMDQLVDMRKKDLKPRKATLWVLLKQCLARGDRLDDSLYVLGCILERGYPLEEGICKSLVRKLCKKKVSSDFITTCLAKILEGSQLRSQDLSLVGTKYFNRGKIQKKKFRGSKHH